MDKAKLMDELVQLIIAECDKEVDPAEIDPQAPLMTGPLDMDSLDALQVALAVKERYGVRIEGGPDGRKAFATLSTLADFVIEGASGAA